MCLIHGPFGCGKSTLLAAMIQLFADSKAIAGTQMRILLAAHTNRAVDNVLSRLLTLGFTGELACTETTSRTAATSSERAQALKLRMRVLGGADPALLPCNCTHLAKDHQAT